MGVGTVDNGVHARTHRILFRRHPGRQAPRRDRRTRETVLAQWAARRAACSHGGRQAPPTSTRASWSHTFRSFCSHPLLLEARPAPADAPPHSRPLKGGSPMSAASSSKRLCGPRCRMASKSTGTTGSMLRNAPSGKSMRASNHDSGRHQGASAYSSGTCSDMGCMWTHSGETPTEAESPKCGVPMPARATGSGRSGYFHGDASGMFPTPLQPADREDAYTCTLALASPDKSNHTKEKSGGLAQQGPRGKTVRVGLNHPGSH